MNKRLNSWKLTKVKSEMCNRFQDKMLKNKRRGTL